jgi:hypothetical protein
MAETDLILAAQTTLIEPSRTEGQVGPLTTNADGRLRVASKPGYFPAVFGDLTTSGTSLVADVTDASNVMLHVKNTGTAAMAAGAFTFEGSLDSTDGTDGTWFALQSVRSNANTIETGRGTSSLAAGVGSAYAWELSVNAVRWFRVRCTTSTTASSIATWTIVRGTYATEPIPAVQDHSIIGSPVVTTTPTNPTAYSVESAASTNAAAIKTSNGSLFEITLSNPTATQAFVKIYNKASAPTVGTDTPIMTIPVPAGAFVNVQFGSQGKRLTAGIAIAVTAAAAKTDTGAAVAGVQIHASYI